MSQGSHSKVTQVKPAPSLGYRIHLLRLNFRLRSFGNTLHLKINLVWWLQRQMSRLFSRGLQFNYEERRVAADLKRTGLSKVGETDVSTISSSVAEYFARNPTKNGKIPRGVAAHLAPEIYRAMELTVEPILNALYGSHFQPYWVEIFRYEAGCESGADSSFGWHLDDNPGPLLKVFLYLNDTYESNAAFRGFDYSTTRLLFKRGLLSCSPELRKQAQSLVTQRILEKLVVLEGQKGSALIFDNNLVHKGTPPKEKHRDVVAIEVYPSSKRFDAESIRKGMTVAYTRDYPANPFFNDIQRTI